MLPDLRSPPVLFAKNALMELIVPDDEERLFWMQVILPKGFRRISLDEVPFGEALQELSSNDLFGRSDPLVLDHLEKLKGKEKSSLQQAIEHARRPLLLASKSREGHFSRMKKERPIYDLSQEKAWEKEKRLQKIIYEALEIEKRRSKEAFVEDLLQRVGPDLPRLMLELKKIFIYTEEPLLERRMLELLVPYTRERLLWQWADEWIWKGSCRLEQEIDSDLFFPLLAVFRKELSNALHLIEGGSVSLPLKILQEKERKAKLWGKEKVVGGLMELFRIEFMAKDGIKSLGALLSTFAAKWV